MEVWCVWSFLGFGWLYSASLGFLASAFRFCGYLFWVGDIVFYCFGWVWQGLWVCLDLVSVCAGCLGRACVAGGVWAVAGCGGLLVVWVSFVVGCCGIAFGFYLFPVGFGCC